MTRPTVCEQAASVDRSAAGVLPLLAFWVSVTDRRRPSIKPNSMGTKSWLPSQLRAGPILLDLFHRDGRVSGQWMGLHPREFEVLWRLAETPRIIVTRKELLKDVWRLDHDPETNRVEVNISRIRAKLHPFRLSHLLTTGARGGYQLNIDSQTDPPIRTI